MNKIRKLYQFSNKRWLHAVKNPRYEDNETNKFYKYASFWRSIVWLLESKYGYTEVQPRSEPRKAGSFD
jgi:hypothetical protein